MLIGDQVTSKNDVFVLEDRIGSGGMGQVFRVRRLRDSRDFALKCGINGERDSIEREAGVLTAFPDHPAIPHLIASGRTSAGEPWFLMPFLRGASVGEVLSDLGALPLPWVMEVAGTICSALQAVHTVGAHRDLKPNNVFVGREGQVFLLDFGIQHIRHWQSEESFGMRMVGTSGYMSPEQLSEQTVDFRSDLFCLGLLIFTMLTGVHPFDLDGRAARKPELFDYRILSETPARMDVVAPHTIKYIGGLCEVLLSRSPNDRPSSVSDVASWCWGAKNRWQTEHGEARNLREIFAMRDSTVRDRDLVDRVAAGSTVVGTQEQRRKLLEDELIEAFEGALTGEEEVRPVSFRRHIICLLVRMGDPRSIPILERLAGDPDFEVRKLAELGAHRLSGAIGMGR